LRFRKGTVPFRENSGTGRAPGAKMTYLELLEVDAAVAVLVLERKLLCDEVPVVAVVVHDAQVHEQRGKLILEFGDVRDDGNCQCFFEGRDGGDCGRVHARAQARSPPPRYTSRISGRTSKSVALPSIRTSLMAPLPSPSYSWNFSYSPISLLLASCIMDLRSMAADVGGFASRVRLETVR